MSIPKDPFANLVLDEEEQAIEAVGRLNKAAENAKKGNNLSGPFKTVDEFMKDL